MTPISKAVVRAYTAGALSTLVELAAVLFLPWWLFVPILAAGLFAAAPVAPWIVHRAETEANR